MWRRTVLAGLAVIALGAGVWYVQYGMPSAQEPEVPTVFVNSATGIAINGYDPVAYFTEAAPVQGSAEFTTRWRGAPWHFASAENRDLFLGDPDHYTPQYGGWCAFAMAQNAVVSTVPEAWSMTDGKLYLNLSVDVRTQWLDNIDEMLPRADTNWVGKLSEAGA